MFAFSRRELCEGITPFEKCVNGKDGKGVGNRQFAAETEELARILMFPP